MAVSVGEITAIASLDDRLTPSIRGLGGSFQSMARMGAAASAAVAAVGLQAGKSWDEARRTIAEGTGATGEALDELSQSWRDLAGTIPGVASPAVATAIADLNTHLGLTGDALETLSTQALQAGIDTNSLGAVAKMLGLDAAGTAELLDDLAAAAQKTGVDADLMLQSFGRAAPRFREAGASLHDLLAITVQAADEFGTKGMRSALTEITQEVEKGVLPSFISLEQQLGDTAGTVQRTYEASIPLGERLSALKDRAMAAIAPYGNLAGAMGSLTTGILGLVSTPAVMSAVGTAAKVMWAGLTGPVGWIIAGVTAVAAAWVLWGDEIKRFLSGVWNRMVDALEFITGPLRTVAGLVGIDLPDSFDAMKISTTKAAESVEDIADAVDGATDDVEALDDAGGALVDSFGGVSGVLTTAGDDATTAGKKMGDLAEEVDEVAERLERTKRIARETIEGWGEAADRARTAAYEARVAHQLAGREAELLAEKNRQVTAQLEDMYEQSVPDPETMRALFAASFGKPNISPPVREAMEGIREDATDYGELISQALVNGQNLGDALVSAWKADAVQSAVESLGIGSGERMGETWEATLERDLPDGLRGRLTGGMQQLGADLGTALGNPMTGAILLAVDKFLPGLQSHLTGFLSSFASGVAGWFSGLLDSLTGRYDLAASEARAAAGLSDAGLGSAAHGIGATGGGGGEEPIESIGGSVGGTVGGAIGSIGGGAVGGAGGSGTAGPIQVNIEVDGEQLARVVAGRTRDVADSGGW